ncbi:hypothetical protein ACFW2V_13570 [Streptomyces sp. NPDC058947]|uniref:hypothetical protein n=1 Tax=Streptomyces sp. NPDC058947 TaxID=3346675 RepID=UPI0036C6804D
MNGKRFITLTRSVGAEASIQALKDPFSGDLTFAGIADATQAIERSLLEHGMQAREAARFAYGIAGCRLGVIHHAPKAADMYYRILVADFTSNNVPITPGLRVLDYDRQEGRVAVPQFMATSSLAPGGEYFNGWYYVDVDGSAKLFNGERLRAL